MSKFNQGYAAILPIIIIVIVAVLALGSFIYTHPGFSLYDLYNIGSPNVTPAPIEVSIDKSNYVEGEVLVVFQSGTTREQAQGVFAKYEITNYKRLTPDSDILSSLDIFVVVVSPGLENEVVTKLKGESMIRSATLNYSGTN